MPVAAGVPGEHWHPGGKHLLQRNTLGLVSAEIDHRAHAAAKGVQLVLAVGAVAQILDNETAASQLPHQRIDERRGVVLAITRNLVVDEDVDVLGRRRIRRPAFGVDANRPDANEARPNGGEHALYPGAGHKDLPDGMP